MKVLLVGATGMLGRPVARQLASSGDLELRALVRNLDRARSLLPDAIELVEGDLREPHCVRTALEGIEGVYLSLNTPFSSREPFDPDRDGTRIIVDAMRDTAARRIVRLSALEASDSSSDWWVLSRKRLSDELVLDCPVPGTILRPTWFMESIPLFLLGRRLILTPRTPDTPLHWISGSDFGRMVEKALISGSAGDRIYPVQGPEPVTMRDAIARFAGASEPRPRRVPLPSLALALGGLVAARARYGRDLLRSTLGHSPGFTSQDAWDDLGVPSIRIEDYARSIGETGDLPWK